MRMESAAPEGRRAELKGGFYNSSQEQALRLQVYKRRPPYATSGGYTARGTRLATVLFNGKPKATAFRINAFGQDREKRSRLAAKRKKRRFQPWAA